MPISRKKGLKGTAMRITLFPFRERSVLRLALGAALTACLLFACRLSQEGELQTTISFNELYDSLKQYDSVVITLKDPEDGHTIDVPFQGKVLIPGDLEKKSTPHWDGGKVLVSVNGYDAQGRLVYRMESIFDGRTNKRDSAYVYVRPGMGLGICAGLFESPRRRFAPVPPRHGYSPRFGGQAVAMVLLRSGRGGDRIRIHPSPPSW
jgi:hypothetical protein